MMKATLDATFFFLADGPIPDEAEEEADKDEDACLPPGVSAFGFLSGRRLALCPPSRLLLLGDFHCDELAVSSSQQKRARTKASADLPRS